MKVYVSSDHAGFALKCAIVERLSVRGGYDVVDSGPPVLEPHDDYPLTIRPALLSLATDLANNREARAIVIGASGQGEAIVANRMKGIRAVVYYGEMEPLSSDSNQRYIDVLSASRIHNDSNVLSLGAHYISIEAATAAVIRWLEMPFSGDERHVRRIQEIDTI